MTRSSREPSAGSAPEVAAWRQERLELAGLDPSAASALARQAAVDLHELLELIDRGCPPHLAVRIRAPLDDQPQLG